MKKYWHSEKFKSRQKKRSKKLLKRRRRSVRLIRARRQMREGKSRRHLEILHHRKSNRRLQYEIVTAPAVMCFLQNPAGMSRFIAKLSLCEAGRKPVYVDMLEVAALELNAVTVLLSVMVRFRASKIRFNGNCPLDQKSATLLRDSRFLDLLSNSYRQETNYDLPGSSIYTHGKLKVDSEFSQGLIERATETVWGDARRCTGVQRMFIELMQNTNNHASSQQGEKHYWISLQHLESQCKVVFTFVDFGVGIFESLFSAPESHWKHRGIKKLSAMCFGNHPKILKKIFEGELHRTSTGRYLSLIHI